MKDYKKYRNETYDEANKYDFYAKYYMNFAVGTKFEDCVEITKDEYKELKDKLNDSKEAMIRVFATYTIGFYKDSDTYMLQSVDKDVYYCLYRSQRYEKNKRRNENFRYLNNFFNQDDINNIASNNNLEDEVMRNIEERRIKTFLSEILSEKQNERFYKNKMMDIPLVIIALEEHSTPDAVRDSVNKAKKQIRKNLKKL